jgi:hypothetical protein
MPCLDLGLQLLDLAGESYEVVSSRWTCIRKELGNSLSASWIRARRRKAWLVQAVSRPLSQRAAIVMNLMQSAKITTHLNSRGDELQRPALGKLLKVRMF